MDRDSGGVHTRDDKDAEKEEKGSHSWSLEKTI